MNKEDIEFHNSDAYKFFFTGNPMGFELLKMFSIFVIKIF